MSKRCMNCPRCGRFMKIVYRRDDGCRYFECKKCGIGVGEETDEWEWFKKQENVQGVQE